MAFLIILGVVAWIVLAIWPASIAKKKGYSFVLFLLFGIIISFLLALLVAVLLKDKTQTAQQRADDAAAEAAIQRDESAQ